MWELWMHLDYDYFYIPSTSTWGKFQLQTILFLMKKAYSFFPVWDLVTTGKEIEKNLFCH